MDRYDIAKDEWFSAPQLQVERAYHSSCGIGQFIYAMCGLNDSGCLNSIERMDVDVCLESWFPSFLRWELLNFANQDALTPRGNTLMAPISDTKILVFGGDDGSYNY